MPIRNPFARRPGPAAVQDENQQRPGSAAGSTTTTTTDAAHPGFERVDTVGSKASSAFSIRSSRKSQDTGEYKMSVVNDSGVYLPPSPIEREASWPRRYLARTSSDKGSNLAVNGGSGRPSGEIEHFSISRESFDSYRRSFDISAKSPVVITTSTTTPDSPTKMMTRQSLDSSLRPPSSAFAPRFPRSSLSDQHRRWGQEPPTPEESETGDGEGEGREGEGGFEDVGLGENGEESKKQEQVPAQVKKRGFFAKFGSDGGNNNGVGNGTVEESGTGTGTGTTAMARFLPPGLGGGRKRAQSGGQGAELGVMPMQAQGVEV